MRTFLTTILLFFISILSSAQPARLASEGMDPVYSVLRLKKQMKIDGDWDKAQWKKAEPIEIQNYIKGKPKFTPVVQAKMMYDKENIYVIFHVQDRFVRSITTEINGPVWKDSAVEFFFSPDTTLPANFFNLEVNCGGTPLLGYRNTPRIKPDVADIRQIEIAHTLPPVTDPEIAGPLTWNIEFRIPLKMLEKYSKVTRPEKGVVWRANFYKIAEINSNPHYLTWAIIKDPKASFHSPQFFGTLKFKK